VERRDRGLEIIVALARLRLNFPSIAGPLDLLQVTGLTTGQCFWLPAAVHSNAKICTVFVRGTDAAWGEFRYADR
jgi:hypothetical protein